MPRPINPKPTTYRGRKYRSRLEARWAVFLDHHPLVREWHYEPKTFRLPGGWTYTPDFLFAVGPFAAFVEVKPLPPTEEYLAVLRRFVPLLRLPLLMGVGDFYKNTPRAYVLPKEGPPPKDAPRLHQWEWLTGGGPAVKSARHFRFDLPHDAPPHKRGKLDAVEALLRSTGPGQ